MSEDDIVLAYPITFNSRNPSPAGLMSVTFEQYGCEGTYLEGNVPIGCDLRHGEVVPVRVLPPLGDKLIQIAGIISSDICKSCMRRKRCPLGGYEVVEG